MKGAISRFRNGRSQEELDRRLHELCDDLETRIRKVSEIPAEQGVHDTDREMIHNYFLRLRNGIKGDHKQAVESNIVYAEVVCHTVLSVFNYAYIGRTYKGTDEAAALLRGMIAGVEAIKQEIGPYEATKYSEHPLEREETFGRIMRHITRVDLEPYMNAIIGDDINFNEGFRKSVDRAYKLISQAVPPKGHIRLDYLKAPLDNLPYNESKIEGLFHDNAAARIEAEGFLIGLRLMKTLAGRYLEHRANPF